MLSKETATSTTAAHRPLTSLLLASAGPSNSCRETRDDGAAVRQRVRVNGCLLPGLRVAHLQAAMYVVSKDVVATQTRLDAELHGGEHAQSCLPLPICRAGIDRGSIAHSVRTE